MTPFDPATSPCKKKSDLPANGANFEGGHDGEWAMRWSLPRLPQVSLHPTMLGWAAESVEIRLESRSMPCVTAGKL